jgi:hypothetical protein
MSRVYEEDRKENCAIEPASAADELLAFVSEIDVLAGEVEARAMSKLNRIMWPDTSKTAQVTDKGPQRVYPLLFEDLEARLSSIKIYLNSIQDLLKRVAL